jgi:hypothetical protein
MWLAWKKGTPGRRKHLEDLNIDGAVITMELKEVV